MKRILMLALLMLTAGMVWAAPSPVTLEVGWNYGFFYKKCTGVTSCVADLTAASPVNNFTGLGAGVSISSLNVVGFSWSILSVGADSTFTISQLIQAAPPANANPAGGTNYNGPSSSFNDSGHQAIWPAAGAGNTISTTTAITAVSGIPLNGQFQAQVANPYFTFTGLTAAATTYVWGEIGIKKVQ